MKKRIFLLLLFLLIIPGKNVNAQDYTLKSGKSIRAGYAGEEEGSYNFFKITPSKSGFIAITVTTSNKQALLFDICNSNKEVAASDIKIGNKQTILHKVNKGKTYYIRVKGIKDATFKISYKMNTFSTLSYAKKYTYTFTNASFTSKSNALMLKVKTSESGILQFMCNSNRELKALYLNSKKKAISKNVSLKGTNFSGIGVNRKKVYYIALWNAEAGIAGTTTLKNIKYQIKSINTTKGKTVNLSYNKEKEVLVTAGEKNTFWYKIQLPKNQKLEISVQSKMLQNNGSHLQLDLYNVNKVKMTSNSIIIDGQAKATYNKKKYVLHYPKKKNITTGKLPAGTYYVRVISKSNLSSGSFTIKWK